MRRPFLLRAAAAAAMAAFLLQTGAGRPAAQDRASRRLLLLTHNAFYKHDSLAAAETAVAELGREGGFEVTS